MVAVKEEVYHPASQSELLGVGEGLVCNNIRIIGEGGRRIKTKTPHSYFHFT